jgi:hypothetical protein
LWNGGGKICLNRFRHCGACRRYWPISPGLKFIWLNKKGDVVRQLWRNLAFIFTSQDLKKVP